MCQCFDVLRKPAYCKACCSIAFGEIRRHLCSMRAFDSSGNSKQPWQRTSIASIGQLSKLTCGIDSYHFRVGAFDSSRNIKQPWRSTFITSTGQLSKLTCGGIALQNRICCPLKKGLVQRVLPYVQDLSFYLKYLTPDSKILRSCSP